MVMIVSNVRHHLFIVDQDRSPLLELLSSSAVLKLLEDHGLDVSASRVAAVSRSYSATSWCSWFELHERSGLTGEHLTSKSLDEVVMQLLQDIKGNSLLDIIWLTDGSYSLEQGEALIMFAPLITAVDCFGASVRIVVCPDDLTDPKCRDNLKDWQELLKADCTEISKEFLQYAVNPAVVEECSMDEKIWPKVEDILRWSTEWRGQMVFDLLGPSTSIRHKCKVQFVRQNGNFCNYELCKQHTKSTTDELTIYANTIEILKPIDMLTIPIHFFAAVLNLEFLERDIVAEKFKNLLQMSQGNMGFLCKLSSYKKILEHPLKVVSRQILEKGSRDHILEADFTKLDDCETLLVIHQSCQDGSWRITILKNYDSIKNYDFRIGSALLEEMKSAIPTGLRTIEASVDTKDASVDNAILKDCVFDLNKSDMRNRLLSYYEQEIAMECSSIISQFSSSFKERPIILDFEKGLHQLQTVSSQLSPVQKVNQNHQVPPFPESRDLAAKKIRSALKKFNTQAFCQKVSPNFDDQGVHETLVDYSRFCDAFDMSDSNFHPTVEHFRGADGFDCVIPQYPKRTHGVDYCFDDWEDVELELRRVRRRSENSKEISVAPVKGKTATLSEGRMGRPGGTTQSLPPPAPRASAVQQKKEKYSKPPAKPTGASRVSEANKALVLDCIGKQLGERIDRKDCRYETCKTKLFGMFYAIYKEDLRAGAMVGNTANELVSNVLSKNLDLILR
ncbi:hypothetical protein GUITHDRAFT_103633 [Guillardia theta CCMP2712]|uniref:Uncharacterized protein n=1 Tax=Guillardia theta (strain CCMP2712) TaxID=905079 RepID=L1JP92_GUITC|nr:hypothetical protein GUITHDRAFT_103633 [Guillardia theta CCMP2712]EKX50401.1 hypothetical protein GUITHDRAFT_103633 [Guillardia theta CCMP2712]|eukprot:XP_005837381.1 hypothetical protein GUITHDRAFT_103633 [Guillardia theta CCMP2712]